MENNFAENISNEDVRELPLGVFEGNIVVVDDDKQIEQACVDLASHSVIGFDTETRPTFKPGALNKVALLQLSTPVRCYLFRLCAVALDRRIVKILESKKILKIGADVKGDIRALQELKHFKANGFVELQSIISSWGVAEKSVRKMSAIVLGKRISKAQRLSNWEAASLTEAQQQYAATDAWICVEIFDVLNVTQRRELPQPDPVDPEIAAQRKSRRRERQKEYRRLKRAEAKARKASKSAVSPDTRVLPSTRD